MVSTYVLNLLTMFDLERKEDKTGRFEVKKNFDSGTAQYSSKSLHLVPINETVNRPS